MIDIDRLHNLFLNEEKLPGRKEGHTTLFVWQLIGLAELRCYSFRKTHSPVYLPFNKPVGNVLNIIGEIEKICKDNDISFSINEKKQFVIIDTAFEFYQVEDIPFNKPIDSPLGSSSLFFFSREDNDATWRKWEMTDQNYLRATEEAFNFVNNGNLLNYGFKQVYKPDRKSWL